MTRPRTLAVHSGREDLPELGVHALPIDLSSTYPVRDLDAAGRSIAAMGQGGRPVEGEMIYARLHNPTVARFEKSLAAMEGMEEAVAFGSGMAAVSGALMAAAQKGREIVAVRPLYGGSDHLMASGMLGLDIKWVQPDGIADAIGPETSMVFLETPSNPTLDLVDLDDVVRQAGSVPVLVDNTFATPILQKPHRHGVKLVLHSGTKFLGGHGDVVAGVVACDEEWAERLRKVRVATGGIIHPLAAYLLHRGMPTLPLRVEAAQANAIEIAARLVAHPMAKKVRHPSLPGQDPKGILGRQMSGPGSLLAFDVEGGYEVASRVMKEVHHITPAVSLGSVDTLIQHPAALTHACVAPEAREACGISATLLRLSAGIEDVEDIWEELDTALRSAHAFVMSHTR